MNSISVKARNADRQALRRGLSSLSVGKPHAILLSIIDEGGLAINGNITIIVEAVIAGGYQSYSDVFDGNINYVLDLYTEAGVAVEHTITLTDGTLTRTYTLTPTLGGKLTLALTRLPINQIDLQDAIGNIATIGKVENAIVSDATGWDIEVQKTVSFPASGGSSNEPLFYFGREASHIRLSADITYTFASTGRTVTEYFDNIQIAE